MDYINDNASTHIKHIRETVMQNAKLYPAGTIIHIVNRNEYFASNQELNSTSTVVDNGSLIAYSADQLTFHEMQISNTMFSSHMPHECLKKIDELFKLV
jgi:hypothetical protein